MNSLIQKTDLFLEKAKIYLKDGEKPPEGVRLQRGSRNGLFYEAGSARSSPKNTTSAQRPGTSVTSVKEPSSPRRSNLMASWSQRYTSPSYLKSIEDDTNLSLHSYYTKMSEVAKKDLQNAIDHIKEATGYTPKARIKDAEKILAKAERYKNQGKDPKDLWDVLGARIIAEDEAKIPGLIKKVMENFPVSEVENWYEKKNDWGYKGVNIRLKLPNGLKAELQIHTEDSALKSVALHGIYDRWKNTVLTQNNKPMFEQDLHHFRRMVSLPLEEFRAQMDPQTLQMAESLLKMLRKSQESYLINSFLNGYKHLALLGLDYPSERLPELLAQARKVAIHKGYTNMPLAQDNDRLGAIIAVDSVAHELHRQKHPDGSSDYPILDKIAEISKAIGEEDDRDNRLLYLSKSAPEDIKTLDHIEILTDIQKGIPLEQGEGYWALLEKAIRESVQALTSIELVLLREFAFARLM